MHLLIILNIRIGNNLCTVHVCTPLSFDTLCFRTYNYENHFYASATRYKTFVYASATLIKLYCRVERKSILKLI